MFRERLKDDNGYQSFLYECLLADNIKESVGRRMFPYNSVFMHHAVDRVGAEVLGKYLKEKREESNRNASKR